jgi:hypothetical protein
MNGRVLVVCASRGRPLELARMLDSLEETSTLADVAVYIDDDQQEDYKAIMGRAIVVVGPRIGQCRSLNHMVKKMPGYDAYGAATDDCCFKTPDWDQWVIKTAHEFKGGIGVIAPFSGGDVPRMDFPWVTGKWLEVVNPFTVLGTHHSFWDVALQILGEATQIKFANRYEFMMWHEGLSGNVIPEKQQTDIGKVVYNIYHVYNDAHCVCVWMALHRQPIIDKLLKAIQGGI